MTLMAFASSFWDAAAENISTAQDLIFAGLIQPLLPKLGLMAYDEDAYAATQWFVVGCLEMLAIAFVLMPLERLRPIERPRLSPQRLKQRNHAIWIDVLYTALDRLGLIQLPLFFTIDPIWNRLFGWLTVHNINGGHLDQWIAPLIPGITDNELCGFLAYAVVLDFVGYLIHRAEHQWDWWWALHAVHHSQQDMTAWSDSRNHLLDTLISDTLFVLVAEVMGVQPNQFVFLVALSRMVESLSHANLKISFGWLGERLLVSPSFHRVHHGLDVDDHVAPGARRSCNFSVLFPIWDIIFKTQRYRNTWPGPTGIRDQLPCLQYPQGRNYGVGFWEQQKIGIRNMWRSL